MLNIILFEPEIPPNTGNIIRLCANSGFALHLIEPLGFDWDDKKVRRAGLDYHEFASVKRYPDLQTAIDQIKQSHDKVKVYACTTKGKCFHSEVQYQEGDILLFGPESRGLPNPIIENLPEQQRLLLPMTPDSRSLNLSNAVAIFVYEAWRQLDFANAVKPK